MTAKTFQGNTATGGLYLWSTAANWDPAGVPTPDDTIAIPAGLVCTYDIIPPAAPSMSVAAGSGSVVATIDGAAGVTNYLRYRGNHSTWQDGGSRSGDGTITVTGLSNDVPYIFEAYSASGGLVSLSSPAVAVTLAETVENDYDDLLVDTAPLFMDEFGETVIYKPRGGGSRTITAIVNRPAAGRIDGLPHGTGPHLTIDVYNDSSTGISAAELDTGGDKVNLAVRWGDTPQDRVISKLAGQDAGFIRLEVN